MTVIGIDVVVGFGRDLGGSISSSTVKREIPVSITTNWLLIKF